MPPYTEPRLIWFKIRDVIPPITSPLSVHFLRVKALNYIQEWWNANAVKSNVPSILPGMWPSSVFLSPVLLASS